MITGDLGTIKDRLTELVDRLSSLEHPGDYLTVSSCDNRRGRPVVRFDVIRLDDDGIERIYRTEVGVDTFRQ